MVEVTWCVVEDTTSEQRIPRFSPPRHLSMGENCGNTVLGQCFVFVETRDKANNDSSAAFAKRIEELGGRVANKLTDKVTHVVFKGGRKTVRTHRAHHLPCGPPVG